MRALKELKSKFRSTAAAHPRTDNSQARQTLGGVDDPVGIRLISKPEVLDRVGVTYPTVWKWMREGKFPRSRELGGKSAWVEAEVAAWIASRPIRRLKGDPQ